MTGYPAEFLPPISVYGVEVVLDRKISGWEKLRCPVSEEKTLLVSAAEIEQWNEEFQEADITE